MGEVEKVKFRLLKTGNEMVDTRTPSDLKVLTLAKLLDFISEKIKDDLLAEEVRKAAKCYPQQALESFKKNLPVHIARCQKKLNNMPFKGEIGEK